MEHESVEEQQAQVVDKYSELVVRAADRSRGTGDAIDRAIRMRKLLDQMIVEYLSKVAPGQGANQDQ